MIAAIVLAAQYAGTFEVFDTSTVRARATQPAPIVNTPQPRPLLLTMDVLTTPAARVRLAGHTSECSLTYSPVLTLPDVELSASPQYVQTVHGMLATAAWHGRRTNLALSEAGAYGQLNSSYLYQVPTAPGQTVGVQAAAKPGTILFGSSSTDGTISHRATRRLGLSATGGYFVAGGLTADSQATLPEQRGPRAGAAAVIDVSRVDSATTIVTGRSVQTAGTCPPAPGPAATPATPQVATPICTESALLLQAEERVGHRLSRSATVSAGAGVAASTVSVEPADQRYSAVTPTGFASFSQVFGARADDALLLSTEVSPQVDLRTGLVSNRLQARATVGDAVAPRVVVRFSVGLLQTVPSTPVDAPFSITIVNGAADLIARLDRQLDLGVGFLAQWQNQSTLGTFGTEIAYVSLTARAAPVHF